MNRAANIALAVLAVLVVGAAVYVIANNKAPESQRQPAAAGSHSSTTSQQTPSVTITDGPSSLGIDPTSVGMGGSAPTIAFLGDDWTAGIGASAKAKRFTTLVCTQLQVIERNFGLNGAGYAKAGTSGGDYRSQVAKIVAAEPTIVVVSGGRNDYSDDAATTAAAAHAMFANLRTKLPDAKLVAIAPFWGDSDLPPEMVALSNAVRKAVTDAGGTYVDITDPVHGHPNYMADDADPNNQGYAAIAAALEPKLAGLLPQ